MEIGTWFEGNWLEVVQTVGILAGLLFTAASLRLDVKTRRVENRFLITHHHRQLWGDLHRRPELQRILDENSDLEAAPITPEEQRFVELLILHLGSVHTALNDGLAKKPHGLEADIRAFFSLPIPATVWEKRKHLRDRDLVDFVERTLTG